MLSETYALMSATLAMLDRDDTTDEDASGLAQSLRELTKIAGLQINDIIMACVQHRRQQTVH